MIVARESAGRRARREKYFRTEFASLSGISNSLGGWWPAHDGEHFVEVICPRCTTLFKIPSGLVMWMDYSFLDDEGLMRGAPDRVRAWMDQDYLDQHMENIEWRAGPCPRCWEEHEEVYGWPMIIIAKDDDHPRRYTMAADRNVAILSMLELVDLLDSGSITVHQAADELRRKGGIFAKLGSWLESRPVTTAAAVALIGGLVNVVGAQVNARDPKDDNPPVIQIINEIDADDDETKPPSRREPSYPRRHLRSDLSMPWKSDVEQFRWSEMGPAPGFTFGD